MTEPTLTELREIANRLLDEIDVEIVADGIEGFGANFTSPTVEPRIAVLQAFLALTDPEPLNAEHCRAQGLYGNEIDEYHTTWRMSPHEKLAVYETQNAEHDFDMSCPRATVGQLRLALLQENQNGE